MATDSHQSLNLTPTKKNKKKEYSFNFQLVLCVCESNHRKIVLLDGKDELTSRLKCLAVVVAGRGQ